MLSSGEAARRLGLSQTTLNRAVARGRITPAETTPGGHHRFHPDDLDALSEQRPLPTLPASGEGRFLTTRQAAKLLGVSQPTIVRAVDEGRLKADLVTPGGHLRFRAESLRRPGAIPADRDLVTSRYAAKALGVSQATVARAVREGQLRPTGVTPGGHYRFTEEELYEQAAKLHPAPAPPAPPPFESSGSALRDRLRRLLYRLGTGPGMAGPPPPPGNGNGNGNRRGNGNGHGNGHGNGNPDRRQQLWEAGLNSVFVIAAVLVALPLLALARGFADLLYRRGDTGWQDNLGVFLAFLALSMGAFFFFYSVKYYVATVVVLLSTMVSGRNARIGRGNGKDNGNGNGNGQLSRHPFVSIHVAAYNEKRVIERLLQACERLDYPNYEVVVVDDSTDESVELLRAWRDKPRFKVLHRPARTGFKGGALKEALKLTDHRAEYVVIWDADSLPFPDSIQRFLPHFYETNGNGNGSGGLSMRREQVAAVQSYQWHVLNKSESWLTEGVRAEYAGSYMIERPFQEALSSLKMVAGTSYMIRADLLRQIGWGTSLTEDWELTLQLYTRGYKVVFTPYAETPAECVGTFTRLARQRMRWAEGHSHNVRRWFFPILLSPFVSPAEKLEFAYYSTYYLQSFLFAVGSLCWLVSELGLHAHVPDWTALLGWSLLFSNLLSLPLMNLGGLVLEEAPRKDLTGVLGALALSYLLVPFQAWASLKGLLGR
ncbi:MAG TPA: helix-turn-helix domain-containing protein, partial [Candidatus Acidoferrales bacterium]|nr:helix-turn-helix domain-containing protein [Candidatus Acidoferrales bacterium]